MEEASMRYAQGVRVDVGRWYKAVHRTAARAAAVLTDDLPAAITVLRRLQPSGGDSWRGADAEETIADLTLFWVSDAAFGLRRRLGIL
jgi:hypothetical protein